MLDIGRFGNVGLNGDRLASCTLDLVDDVIRAIFAR